MWTISQIPSVLSIHYTKVLHLGWHSLKSIIKQRTVLTTGLEHIPTHPLEFPIIPPYLRSSGEHNPNCCVHLSDERRTRTMAGRARIEDRPCAVRDSPAPAALFKDSPGRLWLLLGPYFQSVNLLYLSGPTVSFAESRVLPSKSLFPDGSRKVWNIP